MSVICIGLERVRNKEVIILVDLFIPLVVILSRRARGTPKAGERRISRTMLVRFFVPVGAQNNKLNGIHIGFTK